MDFLTSSGVNFTPPLKRLNNPRHRSFLALAGAQITLDAWNKGEDFPLENDGILTANEISSLNLNGTWLTMFSACETGRGEGRVGEGVLGLRRGFVRAGTQNLLMTLWSVKDNLEEIRQFEREFYQRAMTSKNAPKALNDVQRQWLPQIWEDGGVLDDVEPLLDAVRLIGPFVMSFQGTLGQD
ncbi:MAG: hypothetical protein DRR19_02470 [Candidatus Parabeggiatoa sp. nov. 1]|nr:MAG: hypothetical protein DRR19_02470 [Gammaproteobacteria bacterium]HEC85615.1 CHAT domain-containing protein [Thioploca sp.]